MNVNANSDDAVPGLSRFVDGLPDTLTVRDHLGNPRYFAVLPMLAERSYRRWLAKQLRRRLGFQGQDLEIIETYLHSAFIRQDKFWHVVKRAGTVNPAEVSFQMSLELHLLGDAAQRLQPPAFDEERFALECPEWPAIRASLVKVAGRPLEDIDPHALRYLMCWPGLRDAIATWDGRSEEHFPTLEAIFALSSITNSPWFLNEALRLCPAAAEWLGELFVNEEMMELVEDHALALELEEDSPELSPPPEPSQPERSSSPPLPPPPPQPPAEAAAIPAIPDFPRLGQHLQEAAERITHMTLAQWGEDHSATIRALEEALAALKGFEPRLALRHRLEERLASAHAAVRDFEGRPAFMLVVPDLHERLAEWRSRATRAASAQDLQGCLTALSGALELLEPRSHELGVAYEARQAIRREYDAGRAAADANPSLAAQRAAHHLRERDAAAEGALLNAQSALVDLFVWPLSLTGEAGAPGQGAEGGVAGGEKVEEDEKDQGEEREEEDRAPGRGRGPDGRALRRNGAAAEAVPAAHPEARPDSAERVSEPDQASAASTPPVASREAGAPDAGGEEATAVSVAVRGGPDALEAPRAAMPEAVADPIAAETAQAVWHALSRQRLAVAYQIASLAQSEGLKLPGTPPVPLLQALVLANELLQPDGRIAGQISSALGQVDLGAQDALPGAAEARGATHLILAAAVLRPLLLAPDSVAPELAERARLPDGCGELYTLLQEFVAATSGLRHYRLSARAFAALRDEGAWRGELERLDEQVREWRGRAPHYRIKYQPATAIWREWQKPNGEIDRLLGPIQSNGPAAAERVQAQLARLADPEQLDKAIKEADRKSQRRGEAIHGAALEQLRLHVHEACALAGQWLALIRAKPAKDGPRLRDLERARAALADHRQEADRELEQLARHGDVRVAAAAAIARVSLTQAWALFEPDRPLPAAEKSVQQLLGAPLLQLTEALLRQDGSIREPREARAALIARVDEDPPLQKSFDGRLARGDVVGASLLADLAAAEDPAAAAQMRARLEPAIKEHAARLRQQLTRIGESIQSSIVYGVLASEEGDAFSARLATLDQGIEDLARTDAIEEGARALQEEISALAGERRQQLQEALNEVRGRTDPADLAIIEQALAADDLPSANEYLTRIRSGERLSSTAARPRDPFEELYGGSAAREIEAFLAAERDPAAVIAKARALRPDASDLTPAQTLEAVRLVDLWAELRHAIEGASPVTTSDRWVKALQPLLQLLGFTSLRLREKGSGEVLEAEAECDPIADRALCPVPSFGSGAQGRYRWLCVPARMSIDQLVTRVGPTVNARPTCVLYLGPLSERQRRDLAAETRARRRSFIVLDEVLLMFLTGERGSRLPALFACTLPFGYFDPYVTTSSFVPPELFFGRHKELDRLLDPLGACFVYGGRQLGKTALLKAAERMFHAPERRHYAAWIDLKGAHIGWAAETDGTHVWRPIWKRLVEVGLLPTSTPEPRPTVKGRVEQFLGVLESWLATHREGRILLLLDEADRFLEDDARRAYLDTIRLKRLMEGSSRRLKVAFAGLHNVLRTAEQANHPLGHFGEPIEIGPLSSEWREAQQLVLGPLAAAGFRLERAGMADRILAQTNFYPSLIQLYCSKLIDRMMEEADFAGGPRFLIKEQKLDETYLSRDLRDEIRQKFRLTLQLDPRYAVIAYAIAHRSYADRASRAGAFTPAELAAMARDWWQEGFASTPAPEFRIILDEMVGLGVLRASGDGFTLRNPNLLLLMGTEDEVNEELVRPRDLPEMFVPQAFHPVLAGKGAIAGRHPLTMTQISGLASRRESVVIVAGTRAAGIERVADALAQEHGEARIVPLALTTEPPAFLQDLHERLATRGDGTTLFLVSPEAPWSGVWIELALAELRKLSAKGRRAKVVLIADAAAAVSEALPSLATREGVEVMTVRPWSEGFVRQWLEETRPGDGPAERAALAARTGFWPLLLEDLPQTRIALEAFTGRDALLARVVIALAEYGGAGDTREMVQAEDIAALIEDRSDRVRRALTLAELLGIAAPAARSGWRLEQGLATLFQNGRIARA